MTPSTFPEANVILGAPDGLTDTQVIAIPAYAGEVVGGSVDGLRLVVVAWKPSAVELERLNQGGDIFLSCIGGLPPHFLSTTFVEAINPA